MIAGRNWTTISEGNPVGLAEPTGSKPKSQECFKELKHSQSLGITERS